MSFSKIQKLDIIEQPEKNACCRRAMISGVLAAKGFVEDSCVNVALDVDEIRTFVSQIIEEIYAKSPEISSPPNGGRCKILKLRAPSAVKFVSNINNKTDYQYFFKAKCSGCKAAFWRGVFLACGRVCDPMKQYGLEFSLGERAEIFRELFAAIGLDGRIAQRKNESVIYFKSADVIEDFFALVGMNNAVFAVINAKINRELRNTANRIANCETNNIGKAVNASQKHINAIRDLDRANLLSSLPEELERTARLRLQYMDFSLARLASVAVPPITKSGLSHRLNKILEVAEQKLHKKYN